MRTEELKNKIRHSIENMGETVLNDCQGYIDMVVKALIPILKVAKDATDKFNKTPSIRTGVIMKLARDEVEKAVKETAQELHEAWVHRWQSYIDEVDFYSMVKDTMNEKLGIEDSTIFIGKVGVEVK